MSKVAEYTEIIIAVGIIAIGLAAAFAGKWDVAGLVLTGGFALLTPLVRRQVGEATPPAAPTSPAPSQEGGFIQVRLMAPLCLLMFALLTLAMAGCCTVNNSVNSGEKNAIKTDADATPTTNVSPNLSIPVK